MSFFQNNADALGAVFQISVIPLSVSAVVALYCGKENDAVPEIRRYKMAILVGFLFLAFGFLVPSTMSHMGQWRDAIARGVYFACALGLGCVALRTKSFRSVPAYVLTLIAVALVADELRYWLGRAP